MLAVAWLWHGDASGGEKRLSARLASSLCAGIGGHAGAADIGALHAAYRPLRSTAAVAKSWRPTVLPSGRIVIFHGYIDNAEAVAPQLTASPSNLPLLYGLAVERWGDAAERHIIGDYCAVIAEPEKYRVRLSRSALRAPPLCYSYTEQLFAAASVPRALFAAGVARELDERRVVDSSLLNFTDHEAGWFQGVKRVPVGTIVIVQRGRERIVSKGYDLFESAAVRLASDADYVARASELLDQGVRACLAGFQSPGTTLSGGLDSPQVAVRAAAALPEGRKLPTFTFHPEAGFDGICDPGMVGDERPFVEAFAAMHPRIEPHFTDNAGYEHDFRWNEFFHLMGGAPSGLCNMYVFHGLLAAASKRGCDLLLLAEWGNYTFSDKGDWGWVEYFLRGRWRQLWLSLTKPPGLTGSLPKRFIARTASALLPNPIWRVMRRLVLPRRRPLLDLIQPWSSEYRRASGADDRLRKSGAIFERYQPWNRRHAQQLLFQHEDAEGAEIYQAFEQMYGVALRDPMAYRPFVEFCFGLPVELFMRDGEMRWLAKQMAKGIMPEKQRANRCNGRWDADWHLRIGRRRKDFLAELDRIERNPRLATMFDIPRLRAALEDWPASTVVDKQDYFTCEMAVPRALLAARFINFVEGRNE